MTLRFIHDNLYPLFATLAILAAVICWFGASAPALPQIQPRIADSWNLPKLAESDSKKPIEAINARNLWGAVAADAPKEPEWRVLGIALSGAESFIWLTIEGKPAEMLKIGDTLPDGARIVQIEKDRFFVITPDQQKLAYGIYKHDQAK